MDLEDYDIIFDPDQELINLINEIDPDRNYVIRRKTDHFTLWNDVEFFNRFRLSKNTTRLLLNQVANAIDNRTERNLDRAVPSMDKLLLTLRFLATGDFYISIGDFYGIHKATAGKIIKQVVTALCNLFPQYINLPQNEEQLMEAKRAFYNVARFPRVIGAIDCTHVKIQSPGGDNAEIYRNRKGYFCLNCQVVCSAKMEIIDLVCRWPGSANDTHIFQNSAIKHRLENGDMGNAILIADRGYALKQYILTPLDDPQNGPENLFNESLIRTRNIIERLFRIWKRRFPILSSGIRCKIELTQMIVVACAVLHNIAVEQNEQDFEDLEIDQAEEDNLEIVHDNDGAARMPFIDYFRNLNR